MDRDHVTSPRYIAFEGAEGAGKSSVVAMVGERLAARGDRVVTVREPGGTPVGEAVRSILLDGHLHPGARSEATLFAAARAQLVSEVVLPALEDGAWVLSDRSVYSSLAYQAGGRGLPLDEVRTLNDLALGGVWPHRVVLLRVDRSVGLGRQDSGDRIGDESEEFHDAVVEAFDALAAAEPDRFTVVDATRGIDEVGDTVMVALVGAP
jgi:dTMP kinase